MKTAFPVMMGLALRVEPTKQRQGLRTTATANRQRTTEHAAAGRNLQGGGLLCFFYP
jgi:hypothetical protein